MLKRATNLQFIIGLFFSIVAVILLTDYLLDSKNTGSLNLYTGIGFLVFGLFMLLFKAGGDDKD